MAFDRHYFAPSYWGLWLFFGFARLLVCLPYRWQMGLALFLGRMGYPFVKRRRQVTRINLHIAFPEKTPEEREALCKRCFESIALSAMETLISWFMPEKRFARIPVYFHNIEHFEKVHHDPHEAALILGAHFTCMEIVGRRISERYSPFYLVYQKHKNPLFEEMMTRSREKHDTRCLSRKNVLAIVKALKQKHSVWYAPDQDFGSERTLFVPFFGKDCATLVATSWLAKQTNARVIPCYYLRRPDFSGYDAYAFPPFSNFPSGDDYEDARRYHAFLEEAILRCPEQYLWQHRRYKTRPDGESSIY
ncbi:MAG: bacterial lipid biosynthesis acyltransferase family protein [Gammaproteobacteria bacterium]|jgi:KDO2-lipid IV(A) lauroyltransferase|nr:bacterial lipid biosynthesis acyltransferase family protein [Gammaproteobacteria bacterium]